MNPKMILSDSLIFRIDALVYKKNSEVSVKIPIHNFVYTKLEFILGVF